MEPQDVLDYVDYVDNLVCAKTQKHLDNLQVSILKGVLNDQKYSEIADDYKCTKGHVKDKAYELWGILSKSLGIENINRHNFRTTVEKLKFTNSQSIIGHKPNTQSIIGHKVRIDNMNFCPNTSKEKPIIDNDLIEDEQANFDPQIIVEQAQKQAKLEIIPKLLKTGLTPEQIAETLDLPIDQVKQVINPLSSV